MRRVAWKVLAYFWSVVFAVLVQRRRGWAGFLTTIGIISGVSFIVIELTNLLGCVTGECSLRPSAPPTLPSPLRLNFHWALQAPQERIVVLFFLFLFSFSLMGGRLTVCRPSCTSGCWESSFLIWALGLCCACASHRGRPRSCSPSQSWPPRRRCPTLSSAIAATHSSTADSAVANVNCR